MGRTYLTAAAVLVLGLAAQSISVGAQTGPTLEPKRSFEVASVKTNTSRTRTPMLVIDRIEMPAEN